MATTRSDSELSPGSGLRRWSAVSALLGATFFGTINNSVANVAVPFISADLDVELTTGVWVVTAFALGLGTTMPLAGRLGDVHGQRRVFLWGVVLFAIASICIAFADNIVLVVVGRGVQGVAGAPVLPCIMATIGRLFPVARRGRAIGLWAAVNAAALAAGPSVGGVVVDALSWRALFLISAPAMVVVGLLVLVLVPKDAPREPSSIDLRGALLLAGATALFVLPITESANWGWTSPLTLGCFAACVGCAMVFARHLRTTPEPFIRPALLRAPGFLGVSAIAGLQMVGLFAVTFTVPVFAVVGLGADARTAGLMTSVLPATMLVGAFASGRLAERVRLETLARTGGIAMILGCLLIGALAPSTVRMSLGMVVVGLGISLIQTPTAAAVTVVAPEGQGGVAAGIFNTARFVLGGLGATVAALAFDAATGTPGDAEIGLDLALDGLRSGLAVAVVAGFLIVGIAARPTLLSPAVD